MIFVSDEDSGMRFSVLVSMVFYVIQEGTILKMS